MAFEWDDVTGDVWGPDAELIQERISMYAGMPFGVPLRLEPDSYMVEDPRRRPVEMAVLLGELWELPPELEALYPTLDDATPDGAVN